MHNGEPAQSIPAGDAWLRENLDGYYQWAKTHNSLLIVTFDENDDKGRYQGLTNPMVDPGATYPPPDIYNEYLLDLRNRVVTIFAGAHVKPGDIFRRQRHHPRQRPAHHRGDVWAAEIRRATA